MYKDKFPLTILRHAGSVEPAAMACHAHRSAAAGQDWWIRGVVIVSVDAFAIATHHVSFAAIIAAISSGDASSQSTTISP